VIKDDVARLQAIMSEWKEELLVWKEDEDAVTEGSACFHSRSADPSNSFAGLHEAQ
jgi:hypothetical protein